MIFYEPFQRHNHIYAGEDRPVFSDFSKICSMLFCSIFFICRGSVVIPLENEPIWVGDVFILNV